MAKWGTFEQRSHAAKKGWATRRQRGVEAGTYTEEEFQEKYGHSSKEKVSDWFDEYDVYEDEPNYEPEDNTYDEDEYEYDEDPFEAGEKTHEWLIDSLNDASENAYNIIEKCINDLYDIKYDDEKEYFDNLVNNVENLQPLITEITSTSDVYLIYIDCGEIIEIASGGRISSTLWQMEAKQARREDAFQYYHKTHPNAKYGKRRGSGYYSK